MRVRVRVEGEGEGEGEGEVCEREMTLKSETKCSSFLTFVPRISRCQTGRTDSNMRI